MFISFQNTLTLMRELRRVREDNDKKKEGKGEIKRRRGRGGEGREKIEKIRRNFKRGREKV